MRVGINCLGIDPNFVGGVNSFTLGLLKGLGGAQGHHEFHLYVTPRNYHLFDKCQDYKNFRIIIVRDSSLALKRKLCRASLFSHSRNVYRFLSNTVFRSVRERMESESDLVYIPTVVLQCFNNQKPTVLSMHDIQHVHHPEFFNWVRRLSRSITYDLSARYARYFQASSHFIKQDLLSHFHCISERQIDVIPEGVLVEEFAAPKEREPISARYGLPDRFLLLPAQLWPHKNHLTLLQALRKIQLERKLKIPLVLTGSKYSAAAKVLAYISENKMTYVQYLGKVPFNDLVALYQQAALLVMPSLHESSSLPILEAAAAGIPVIASRIPPNDELARVLSVNLFDPLNISDLVEKILWLWQDTATANQQIEYNRGRISAYSWQTVAGKYLDLFTRALAC